MVRFDDKLFEKRGKDYATGSRDVKKVNQPLQVRGERDILGGE